MSLSMLFLLFGCEQILSHTGPQSSYVSMTKNWVYTHIHAQISIYQSECGRRVRSNQMPGLSLNTQVSCQRKAQCSEGNQSVVENYCII